MRHVRSPGGADLVIAAAGPDDHDGLYHAFAQVVAAGEGYPQAPGPLPVEEFEEYWLDHKSLVAVARQAGRLVLPQAELSRPRRPHRQRGYFVVASARGLGIGTALVEDSLGEARRLGFDALQFNLVFASNPVRRLYERLGFAPIGRIPDAVDGEDAVVYWRRL